MSPQSLEELEEIVKECAAGARPPMVVANPDLVTTSGAALITMPGHLGRIYSQLGGQVPSTSVTPSKPSE